MEPTNSSDFDLVAWVADTMPDLLDAEADERFGDRRPVTALTAEGSPLQTFLRADPGVDETLPRAERAAVHEQWRATRAAATEAALDAEEHHRYLVELYAARDAADHLDARLARAAEAAEERKNGSTKVTVTGAERPANSGRW